MHQDLRCLEGELVSTLAGLDTRQTQATPLDHPEKWTIQQIVEHLLLTYRATIAAIQTRLDKRSPTQAVPTVSQRAGQFVVLSLGRFPNGRSSPDLVSPSLPATLRAGDDLAQRAHIELKQVDAITSEAELLFGNGRSVSHMILGPLSMSQWRCFHLVHGRHHLKQIRSIRRDHAF